MLSRKQEKLMWPIPQNHTTCICITCFSRGIYDKPIFHCNEIQNWKEVFSNWILKLYENPEKWERWLIQFITAVTNPIWPICYTNTMTWNIVLFQFGNSKETYTLFSFIIMKNVPHPLTSHRFSKWLHGLSCFAKFAEKRLKRTNFHQSGTILVSPSTAGTVDLSKGK